jgi:hypothetical protein
MDSRSEYEGVGEVALHDDVERIETRADLASFIERLRSDFEQDPTGWQNRDLSSYLEALAAWATDMPGYFENRGLDMSSVPRWRLLGMMLLAARTYE